MQARVKAQSTSGQTWLSALRTPKKKKVWAGYRAEATVSFQARKFIQRLQVKPLDQTVVLCIGTKHGLFLFTQTWRNTTEHRNLSLFKIDMFLKSWLHNRFHHVELYSLTDFNKTVGNTFK